jgi:hypothetical protein
MCNFTFGHTELIFAAAAIDEFFVSRMFLGDWQVPAISTPSITVSTGAVSCCISLKKLSRLQVFSVVSPTNRFCARNHTSYQHNQIDIGF